MAHLEKPFQTVNNMLIFASNNLHKVEEIKQLLNNLVDVVSMKDAGIEIDIPEPYDTLEANASTKSKTIYQLTGKNCFSEDTGLEVSALNGAPGVKTARYNEDGQFASNNDKLLFELTHQTDRSAQFRTVISLILDGEEYFFEGCCIGTIALEPSGDSGFGYDPIFIPEGSDVSFGAMSMAEKNKFSHRKKAIFKMMQFLQEQTTL